jgi:hypothetical protein
MVLTSAAAGMVHALAAVAPAIRPASSVGMTTASGTAAGGTTASVHAGCGRMTTPSTCGFVFEDEERSRNKLNS